MTDYKTKHYVFHCINNDIAERDIQSIAKTQEAAYTDITTTLDVKFDEIINYYLVNTPEEVAQMTGYNCPVNGLACFASNSVYAVYNDEVKCIGAHEDAHLISDKFGISDSDFLSEGLAMHFDKCWWRVKNELWCKYFLNENLFVNPLDLLSSQKFYDCDCAITYPIAGAFTSFLIKKCGIDGYKRIYTAKSISDLKSSEPFSKELSTLTNAFINEINAIIMTDDEKENIQRIFQGK